MKTTQLATTAEAAHALALELYRFTARWPESERDGLTLEVRRAGRDLASCLSEADARLRGRALRRAVDRARSRHASLAYLIRLTTDMGYRKLSSSGKVDGMMERLDLDLGALALQIRSRADTVATVGGVSAGASARASRFGS
jgi:four helix bundle protein